MAPEETQEMMVLADEDGDGNINYEEFISMLFKVCHPIIKPKSLINFLMQRPSVNGQGGTPSRTIKSFLEPMEPVV